MSEHPFPKRLVGARNEPRDLKMRLFQQISRFKRAMTLGVRIVVENPEGQVLMVRHTYTPGWHVPGGGVEKGSSVYDAACEELLQEVGVIPTGGLTLHGIFSNHAIFPDDHVVVMVCKEWRRDKATSIGEIAETGFFDPRSPPEGTTPGTLRRFAELYAGAPISSTW